jgi:hypothetical protein
LFSIVYSNREHVININILYLRLVLGCLVALIICWGKKVRCVAALALILVSSQLVVLAVLLLLLRGLPLELLLMRTLVLLLILLRVTVLELLG